MRWLLIVSIVVMTAHASLGQRFELVEPSGLVTATVEIDRTNLLIRERSGEQVLFSREARYDSADRQFIAYFSFKLNRVLRFPRSGRGVLQTAELNDPSPQYRRSIRVARPAGVTSQPGPVAPVPSAAANLPPGNTKGQLSTYPNPQAVARHSLVDSKTVPNPPLPPAVVVLQNGGPSEIQVSIVDAMNPGGRRTVRIQPTAAVELKFERDSGSKRIDQFRVSDATGELSTKEIVTQIPASLRYELLVDQWAVQSVAIDRTGRSPNVIEDINYQGSGLGRFHLPPGPQLQSGTIDVYRAALNGTHQPGASVDPSEQAWKDPIAPLERAIIHAQRAAYRD